MGDLNIESGFCIKVRQPDAAGITREVFADFPDRGYLDGDAGYTQNLCQFLAGQAPGVSLAIGTSWLKVPTCPRIAQGWGVIPAFFLCAHGVHSNSLARGKECAPALCRYLYWHA